MLLNWRWKGMRYHQLWQRYHSVRLYVLHWKDARTHQKGLYRTRLLIHAQIVKMETGRALICTIARAPEAETTPGPRKLARAEGTQQAALVALQHLEQDQRRGLSIPIRRTRRGECARSSTSTMSPQEADEEGEGGERDNSRAILVHRHRLGHDNTHP